MKHLQATITTLRRYAKYPHISSLLAPELDNAADAIEELKLKLDIAQDALQSIADEGRRQDQPWFETTAREALERIK